MFDPINIDDRETKLKWNITPLFPKPISISFIDEEACIKLQKLADNTEWFRDTPDSGSVNNGASSDKYVLNKDEDLKKYLLNYCYSGLGMLGFNTELQITTSWFTITERDGQCRQHKHTNSWWSSVIYFDEYDDTSSAIHFTQEMQQIWVEPQQHNYMNSSAFNVHPAKGMILLFPSQVFHQILHGKNDKLRRSLALNVMPKGLQGSSDSMFYY